MNADENNLVQKRTRAALAPLAALRESWVMRADATRPIDRAIQRLNDAFADVMIARKEVAQELFEDGDINEKDRADLYETVRECVAKTISANLSPEAMTALRSEAGPARLLTIQVTIDAPKGWTAPKMRAAKAAAVDLFLGDSVSEVVGNAVESRIALDGVCVRTELN